MDLFLNFDPLQWLSSLIGTFGHVDVSVLIDLPVTFSGFSLGTPFFVKQKSKSNCLSKGEGGGGGGMGESPDKNLHHVYIQKVFEIRLNVDSLCEAKIKK